jgi:hypothetical protein
MILYAANSILEISKDFAPIPSAISKLCPPQNGSQEE